MDFEASNVKTLAAEVIRQVSEVMGDLAFARCRAANENDYVKGVFFHKIVGTGPPRPYQLLFQVFFHRDEQFFQIGHLDLAHMGNAEGDVLQQAIAIGETHAALHQEGVQVS